MFARGYRKGNIRRYDNNIRRYDNNVYLIINGKWFSRDFAEGKQRGDRGLIDT